jgi:hypothetical protein
MTTQMIIRFQKADTYGNSIFIAGVEDVTSFETLTRFSDSLKKQELVTFLPIYATEKFATIRFKPNNKFKFVENSTYEIEFQIRKKLHKEKFYISCYVLKSKLVTAADPKDYGDIIEL